MATVQHACEEEAARLGMNLLSVCEDGSVGAGDIAIIVLVLVLLAAAGVGIWWWVRKRLLDDDL